MGLDITAYAGLVAVRDVPRHLNGRVNWDAVEEADELSFYANDDFPGRDGGFDCGKSYAQPDDDARCHAFSAGSYSGYSRWREQLAKLVGWDGASAAWKADGGAFWELIHFSDCEGIIGGAVAAKLARDFAEHQAKVDALSDDDLETRWFVQLYADWRKAFELAANGGVVHFH
jgi:hypothetical protein